LGTVIELCRRCGFDIPVGADGCPGCGAERVEAERLAARQLAGLALPTRSVRSLPNTPPQHVAEPPPVTPAVGARTVFAYTWLLTVVAVLGGLLAWVAMLYAVPAAEAGEVSKGCSERLAQMENLLGAARRARPGAVLFAEPIDGLILPSIAKGLPLDFKRIVVAMAPRALWLDGTPMPGEQRSTRLKQLSSRLATLAIDPREHDRKSIRRMLPHA